MASNSAQISSRRALNHPAALSFFSSNIGGVYGKLFVCRKPSKAAIATDVARLKLLAPAAMGIMTRALAGRGSFGREQYKSSRFVVFGEIIPTPMAF